MSYVLMAPTEGEDPVMVSHVNSACVLLSALFVSCSFRALIFALYLVVIITMTVMKTTTQIINTVAREPIDAMYAITLPESPRISLGTRRSMLMLAVSPLIFPQTIVCTANSQTCPLLVGT